MPFPTCRLIAALATSTLAWIPALAFEGTLLRPSYPLALLSGGGSESFRPDAELPDVTLPLPDFPLATSLEGGNKEAEGSEWERRESANAERQLVSESEAELALRVGDLEAAAKIYAQIAAQSLDPERRRNAFFGLAEVYQKMDEPLRVISVLERFRTIYPDDPTIPELLLRLGFLYRETGSTQKAVDSFFGVLKESFVLRDSDMESYRSLTAEASYQIAETYYRMQQYELAGEFFGRLLRAARMSSGEHDALLSKTAYAAYFAGDYRKVVLLLEPNQWGEISASRQAEFRFLRASAYWALGDHEAARSDVLNLATLEVEPLRDSYWNFWWKHIGNELANDLYGQGDYELAHKLYYSLLHLSNEPEWQLPVIFQIARCRQGLGEIPEAESIYGRILDEIDSAREETLTGSLLVLESRVQDQMRHLAWEKELTEARKLYAPSGNEAHDSFSESSPATDARSG